MAMDVLLAEAAALGITIPAATLPSFIKYHDLLQNWNQYLNLTAIRDSDGIRQRHFLDSLTCVLATGDLNGQHLIDVGTGAGFPGLVLKIVFPGLRLTLVESVAKKCRFLEAITDALGLSEVSILAERAELLGQDPGHRERYDWAVARAVAPLPTLLEYLLPLTRVGGHALALRGPSAVEESVASASANALLGGVTPQLQEVILPDRDQSNFLITVPKRSPTPIKYPRRIGLPAKRPLVG